MRLLAHLFPLLLIALVLMTVLASVLGASIGIGWVLSQLVAFTLYEGTFVGFLALAASAMMVSWLFAGQVRRQVWAGDGLGEPPASEVVIDFDAIPVARFVQDHGDYTWENWTRFNLANSVYIELQDAPRQTRTLNHEQQRELAIRLADVAVAILKAKPSTTRRLAVNVAQFRQQLSRMGQHPYDDIILELAVSAVNEDLTLGHPQYLDVVLNRTWSQAPG